MNCPEWLGLAEHCGLHVPTPPIFFVRPNWVFESSFSHPTFTVARIEFAVSTFIQFLRVATDDVFGSFCLYEIVQLEKHVWLRLCLSVILLIEFMSIKKIV